MTIVKAAIFLLAAASFGVTSTKPIAAESEQAQFYNSPAAAAANLPFSQAVRVGDIWYLSGAIGVVPRKMELAPGGLEAEAKQTMENIGAILRSNGLSFDDVFKCTVMIADMAKWGAFNKIYVTYFKPDHLPAPLLAQMDWHWGHRSNWNAGLLLTNSDQPI